MDMDKDTERGTIKMDMEKDVLTSDEAADLLGLSVFTVRDLARLGRIPARKVGKAWRFSRPGLMRWLENQETDTDRED
jgi:excisionase family DNA binding protein